MNVQRKEVHGWRKWFAFLRNRCPRCGQGRIFAGQFQMNDPCPVCGLIFQREEGYFLGSMYFGYMFGCLFIGGGFFLLSWLLPTWNDYAIVGVIVGVYLLLVPFVFRRSRSSWIYFDRWGCLGDVSDGAYEKAAKLNAQHD